MRKEEVIRILKEHMDEIKKFGVKRIGIFGSVARDEANEKSDIDFVAEFEEGKKTFDNFMELVFYFEELFGRRVDVLTSESVSPYLKEIIEKEVIYENL